MSTEKPMPQVSREEAERLIRRYMGGPNLEQKTAYHFGRYELVHILDAIYGPVSPEDCLDGGMRYLGQFEESFTERRQIDLWFNVQGVIERTLGPNPVPVWREHQDETLWALWRAMCGRELEPELAAVTQDDLRQLRAFARQAGGWIHTVLGRHEFIPLDRWAETTGMSLPAEDGQS